MSLKEFIELLPYELAASNLGMHPESVNGVKRTPYKEGWNAAVTTYYESVIVFSRWFEALETSGLESVLKLVQHDALFIRQDEGEVSLFINTSDIFAWACADCEEVELDELDSVVSEITNDPKWGVVKWVCRRENLQPQSAIKREMKGEGAWCEWMDNLKPNKPH